MQVDESANFRRHRTDRPARRVDGRGAQRPFDHGGNLIVVDSSSRPGRTSSSRPSPRSFKKRRRHLPTVCSWRPSSAATDLLGKPFAPLQYEPTQACRPFGRPVRAHTNRPKMIARPDRSPGVRGELGLTRRTAAFCSRKPTVPASRLLTVRAILSF
jgi:hypothetical protein